MLGRPPGDVLFESLHGAPKSADAPPGAIGYRPRRIQRQRDGGLADAALDGQHVAWSRETAAAIEPWSYSGGGYANYMQADEPLERVRAMFADEAFDRLQALKRRYDPENACAGTRTSRRASSRQRVMITASGHPQSPSAARARAGARVRGEGRK